MTVKEAIAVINSVKFILDNEHYSDDVETALDMAIEALKGKCSENPNGSNLISRQDAIDALDNIKIPRNASWYPYYQQALTAMGNLPPVQPEKRTQERTETHSCDCISRQKVRYKLTALVNEIEEIFANIRESTENDSVCGLCEYDGAYIGQSGDWYNECPGFDRADCFKLKDKYREEWVSIDE